jgi:hypothetical protein
LDEGKRSRRLRPISNDKKKLKRRASPKSYPAPQEA